MSDAPHDELRLTSRDVAWTPPESWLSFETTADLAQCQDFSGQPEAIAALRLGIRLRARGYNVFVAGMPGTGRTSSVRRVLVEEAASGPVSDDLCYVHNLDDPRTPRFLRLPPGRGRALKAAMASAAEHFRQGVTALRASRAHRRRRETVAQRFRERQSKLLASFQETVAQDGFALVEVNLGNYRRQELAPLVGEQPVALDDLEQHIGEEGITEERVQHMRKRYPALMARLAAVTGDLRKIGLELEEALVEEDKAAGSPLVEEALAEIRTSVGIEEGGHGPLDEYLSDVSEYMLNVVPLMFSAGEQLPNEGDEQVSGDPLVALHVRVLVDRSAQRGRPVVEEPQPSPARLLGSLRFQVGPDGSPIADLEGLHAGALHRADGGFLLINALELINEDGAWQALRRALRTGEVDFHVQTGNQMPPPPIVPQRAPVDVTIILVGPPGLRDHLASGDPEFDKLFKIVALFEDRIDATEGTINSYACFLAKVVEDEDLLPIRVDAVKRMLSLMVRAGGGQGKISTRFRLLADIAREANWFASEAGAESVASEHVDRVVVARRDRTSALSKRILASIDAGVLHLEFDGERVGQINGLAVVETSLERFGYPVRLTATSSVGRDGIIDIEREAELAGEIHTKASLILAGFLRSLFAQKVPLTITASICFEQSYGGVEGDSASVAELAALLSSLAGLPLRQNIAVTGAVDQRGQVLAVGGVNEKVEGFWAACRAKGGLTGRQGVILPRASVPALQLHDHVRRDVAEERFHVYAAETVQQVMELMTGMPFGEPAADGTWPAGTIGHLACGRLAEMAEIMRRHHMPGGR